MGQNCTSSDRPWRPSLLVVSPNCSPPELQALKKSVYDHEDYAFILYILSSKKKWMTKEKKAQLLKKFIKTTNDYSVTTDQEFYNLVLKEMKLSGIYIPSRYNSGHFKKKCACFNHTHKKMEEKAVSVGTFQRMLWSPDTATSNHLQ